MSCILNPKNWLYLNSVITRFIVFFSRRLFTFCMGFICSNCRIILSFMLELYLVIKSFCFVLQIVGFTIKGANRRPFWAWFSFLDSFGNWTQTGLSTSKLWPKKNNKNQKELLPCYLQRPLPLAFSLSTLLSFASFLFVANNGVPKTMAKTTTVTIEQPCHHQAPSLGGFRQLVYSNIDISSSPSSSLFEQ
jgi:hypothetical protein